MTKQQRKALRKAFRKRLLGTNATRIACLEQQVRELRLQALAAGR